MNEKLITLSANTSWFLYNYYRSTIAELVSLGYRVVCISPEDAYSRKLESDLGCEWIDITMDNKGTNPVKDLRFLWDIWRNYNHLRPSVALHFTIKNNIYGTWAASALGIPTINNVSGLGTAFIHGGITGKLVRLLYQFSQPFAQTVFCLNTDDFDVLLDKKLVPREKLKMLPGAGVDLARFQPATDKEPSLRPLRFVYAGRMLADKGLYELIAATKEINSAGTRCELWLCGFADAKNLSSISEEELHEWGRLENIKWIGPTDQIENIYCNSDCVILPSYREGIPSSLLEAGAMGLPAIATNVAGCRHVIHDGQNGFLCEPRNILSLKQVMVRMIEISHGERERMGVKGRTLVEKYFDQQFVVNKTIDEILIAIK